jgi:hypothetical protein
MQALVIAARRRLGRAEAVEVERYRAAPIEVDDTSCLRVEYAAGRVLTAAVTLAAHDVPGR